MPPRVVARLGRRREGGVGEGADRDDDDIRLGRLRVEDLRAAGRAEVEDVLLPIHLVRDPRVVLVATVDLHLIRFEPRLHAEGASGPPLTGEAVADRDRERFALDVQAKLPAVTRRVSRRHGVARHSVKRAATASTLPSGPRKYAAGAP